MRIKLTKKNPLIKKLKGYQKAPKGRFHLFSAPHKLTAQEFVLYEFAIAITDWDPDHETYGTFEATNQQIAEILGYKSDASVSRLIERLLKKRLLSQNQDGRFKANGFEKWELRRRSKKQEMPEIYQESLEKNQELLDENQDNRTQNSDHSLGSFKGGIGSSIDMESEEEFKKLLDVFEEV